MSAIDELDELLESLMASGVEIKPFLHRVCDWFVKIGFAGAGLQLDFYYEKFAEQNGSRWQHERVFSHDLGAGQQNFGVLRLLDSSALKNYSVDFIPAMVHCLGEVLDNVLYQMRVAFIKHRLLNRLQIDLLSPVPEKAFACVAGHCQALLGFSGLHIVYDEGLDDDFSLHVQSVDGHYQQNDFLVPPDYLREQADFARELFLQFRTENVTDNQCYGAIEGHNGSGYYLGRKFFISAGRRTGFLLLFSDQPLHQQFREISDVMVSGIQESLNNFFKTKKQLRVNFNEKMSKELISCPDYEEKYLSPRQAECGILYADISGFTRYCEQSLQTPEKIAGFVDQWTIKMLEILFEHGGVFDKLVGDCVIALFGPPFFRQEKAAVVAEMCVCARKMLQATKEFCPEVGLAIGFNYAPAFVGRLGAAWDYTALSQGMNNTARLQCLARKNEILYFSDLHDEVCAAGFNSVVEEPYEAFVKNVQHPLKYYALQV
jgi:class 3 adenylate cyclase